MTYEEAKTVVKKFFSGISQPVTTVTEALGIVLESDYNEIQEQAREQTKLD